MMSRSNRRKSIFEVTVKETEIQRELEHQLSYELYQNLKLLSLFQPFTNELKMQVNKEMFRKSNPKAFQEVIYWLFSIYDINLFKKRFQWPIYNKSLEADFRNEVLLFFNECIKKFNWNIETVKMQTVLFPGGCEFLKVILEFSNVVIRKLLRRYNFSETTDSCVFKNAVEKKFSIVKRSYEDGIAFCDKLGSFSEEIKHKTEQMLNLTEEILRKTTVERTVMLNGSLVSFWYQYIQEHIDCNIETLAESLTTFQRKCRQLDIDIIDVCKARSIDYNSSVFTKFLDSLKQRRPDISNSAEELIVNKKINFDNLLHCFEAIMPSIFNNVSVFKPLNLEKLNAECENVNRLSLKVNDMVKKVNIYQQKMNENSRLDKLSSNIYDDDDVSCPNGKLLDMSVLPVYLKTTVLTTPPISFETIERSSCMDNKVKFISLLTLIKNEDDLANCESTDIVNQQINIIDRSVGLMTAGKRSRLIEFDGTMLQHELKPDYESNAVNIFKRLEKKTKYENGVKRQRKFSQTQCFANSTAYAGNGSNFIQNGKFL